MYFNIKFLEICNMWIENESNKIAYGFQQNYFKGLNNLISNNSNIYIIFLRKNVLQIKF